MPWLSGRGTVPIILQGVSVCLSNRDCLIILVMRNVLFVMAGQVVWVLWKVVTVLLFIVQLGGIDWAGCWLQSPLELWLAPCTRGIKGAANDTCSVLLSRTVAGALFSVTQACRALLKGCVDIAISWAHVSGGFKGKAACRVLTPSLWGL